MRSVIKISINKSLCCFVLVSLLFFLKSTHAQSKYNIDLSGEYESSSGQYILQLIQVIPSTYYYEFIPKDRNDSLTVLNAVMGVCDQQIEGNSFKTTLTSAFMSGFDFKLNGLNFEVNVSRFSYDYRYSDLVGQYSKLKNTAMPQPHYEMFFNKEKYHAYKSAVNKNEIYLSYFPLYSNKIKQIHIDRKTRLKLFNTVFNFALGDMSEQYYYIEVSNGKNIEYGWLAYRDLKYFKFLKKT